MTCYWIDCCNRLAIKASSRFFDEQDCSLGIYKIDGVSNRKPFYKNEKNSNRYDDDRSVDTCLGDRYLHFSSIINNWGVNTGNWTLLLPVLWWSIYHSRLMELYWFNISVLISRYQTNLANLLNLETYNVW